MNKEEMKKGFPETPQVIRDMIECEVYRQMERTDYADGKKGSAATGKKAVRSMRKTVAIAAAAVLAIGTTAFAGGRIYDIYMEKQGNYGVKTRVSVEETQESSQDTEKEAEGETVSAISMKGCASEAAAMEINLNWLPEGMIRNDNGSKKTWSYEETPYQGGLSLLGYKLDEGEVFEFLDENIVESEDLTLGDHQGVLLRRHILEDGRLWMDKIVYILYPEYSRVVQMYVGEDVSREDAIKIAENIVLEPMEDADAEDGFMDWSDYKKREEEKTADGGSEYEIKITATADEMKNVHKIGEPVTLTAQASDDNGEFIEVENGITACVTDVQTADDLSLLDQNLLAEYNSTWLDALDENGKLKTNILQFVKSGDGINTVDEVIKTEEVGQKLVYVTVEYTNTGSENMNEVLYNASFGRIVDNGEGYQIYDRQREESGEWDDIVGTGIANMSGEMDYYDVHGGARGNNYIPSIAPGETVTVHMAAVVNEDELDKLYLDLSGFGSGYEFSEQALETGYVDIRQ